MADDLLSKMNRLRSDCGLAPVAGMTVVIDSETGLPRAEYANDDARRRALNSAGCVLYYRDEELDTNVTFVTHSMIAFGTHPIGTNLKFSRLLQSSSTSPFEVVLLLVSLRVAHIGIHWHAHNHISYSLSMRERPSLPLSFSLRDFSKSHSLILL